MDIEHIDAIPATFLGAGAIKVPVALLRCPTCDGGYERNADGNLVHACRENCTTEVKFTRARFDVDGNALECTEQSMTFPAGVDLQAIVKDFKWFAHFLGFTKDDVQAACSREFHK